LAIGLAEAKLAVVHSSDAREAHAGSVCRVGAGALLVQHGLAAALAGWELAGLAPVFRFAVVEPDLDIVGADVVSEVVPSFASRKVLAISLKLSLTVLQLRPS
jgi:hypothetical protein